MKFFENEDEYEKQQVYAIHTSEGRYTAMWDGHLFIGCYIKDGAWGYQMFVAVIKTIPCGFSMIKGYIPHIHMVPFIYNAFPDYYKK